jgi:PPOX class probable F420-dependent enzyme
LCDRIIPTELSGSRDVELLAGALARELLQARLIANLATFNGDGTIHLVPMWFLWEADAVLIPTSGASRKARNARRDARAAVMVDDSRGGLDVRGITMTGHVEILAGPEAESANRRVHRKYVTEAGLGLPEVQEALATDDVTLRFLPEQARAWDLSSHPASRLVLEAGAFEPLVPVHRKPAGR